MNNVIDNFEKFNEFMSFDSPGEFYFCQVIRRGKDSNLTSADNYHVKSYFVKSHKQFGLIKQEIINMCTFHGARGYIHLNKRSFKKCAFRTLKLISEDLLSDNFEAVKRAYTSVCGSFPADNNKKWLIDIDAPNPEKHLELLDLINNYQPVGRKEILNYKTKSGEHQLVKPFDLQSFRNDGGEEILKSLDATIFKDGMSLLYCNL